MHTADDTRRNEEFNKVEWSVDHNPRVSFFCYPVSVYKKISFIISFAKRTFAVGMCGTHELAGCG